MVNSATAEALPPRGIDDADLPVARRGHVDVHRAPARDGNELQPGQPLEHSGGEGGEMGDGDLGGRPCATTSSAVP